MAGWASLSWAPCAAHKKIDGKEKFFLYFCNGGNNHHSIAELNGKLYLFYHTRLMESVYNIDKDNGGYRNPMVNAISTNGTKLNRVTGNTAGVSQLKKLDPYTKVQAETISRQSGISVIGNGDTYVAASKAGDWIGVKGVNFSNGASQLTINARSANSAAVKGNTD